MVHKFKNISDKILNTMQDGVYITDDEFNILYVNPACKKIFGDDTEKKCFEYFHDSAEPCSWCQNEKIFAGETVQSSAHRYKNGKEYDVIASPFYEDDKVHKLGILRDVTEIKKTIKTNTLLFECSKKVLESTDFMETARHIFDACCDLTGATAGYVALLSEDGQENEVLFLEAGGRPCSVDPNLPMPIRGLRAESYKSGKAVYDNDFMSSKWMDFMPSGHVCLDNVLFAPLNIEGKTLGIMGVANKPEPFTDEDAKLSEAFGDLAAIALKNSRHIDQISSLSKFPEENNNPVIRIDSNGNVLFHNTAGLDLLDVWGCQDNRISGEPKKVVVDSLKDEIILQKEYASHNRTYSLNFTPIKTENYVNIYGTDITELKKNVAEQRRLQKRLEALWGIAKSAQQDIDKISHKILTNIAVITESQYGLYGFLNDDETVMSVLSWSKDVMNDCMMHNKPIDFDIETSGLWGNAVRERKPVIYNDITKDLENKKGTPEGHVEVKKLLSFPIIENGKITAIAAVANKKDDYDINDINQLDAFFSNIRILLDKIKYEKALSESEKRFKSIVANTEAGYFFIDKEGLIRDVNESWLRLYKYPSKDMIIGKHFNEIQISKDANKARAFVKEIMNNNPDYLSGEFTRKCFDGTEGVHSFSAKPVIVDGELKGIEGFIIDITEQKILEDQLHQSEKMQAVGQLAGGIAHDFNNQLTSIMGFADILASRLEDPKHKEYASNIVCASTRSKELTQQLLTFARKGKFTKDLVDVHEIINEAIELMLHSLHKKIKITQYLNAERSYVVGDPSQLQNIFVNLGINARDAMPCGGELIFRTATSELSKEYCEKQPFEIKPGKYLKVAVQDSGIGMNKETQSRMFEPFFTTKPIGKGTGLGLAAVYGSVKKHNGAINVVSEPDKGTTITIFLPLSKNDKVQNKKSQRNRLIKGTGKVLFVDDEDAILEIGTTMLSDLGYKVITKSNGNDALKYYKRYWDSVDLVLLDIVMPNMSGKEVFNEMKQINPDIKCVLSSGYSIDGEADKILKKGALDFIQKPYCTEELSIVIHKALNK